MKKHLAIEILTVPGCGEFLRVKEQTHIDNAFGDSGDSIFKYDGFEIQSYIRPEWVGCRLYVRGLDVSKDNSIICLPSNFRKDDCIAAVKAYNKYFGGEEKKEVKQDGFRVEVIE